MMSKLSSSCKRPDQKKKMQKKKKVLKTTVEVSSFSLLKLLSSTINISKGRNQLHSSCLSVAQAQQEWYPNFFTPSL